MLTSWSIRSALAAAASGLRPYGSTMSWAGVAGMLLQQQRAVGALRGEHQVRLLAEGAGGPPAAETVRGDAALAVPPDTARCRASSSMYGERTLSGGSPVGCSVT